jgi:hypothetical protein
MCVHVDDIMWGIEDEHESHIRLILEAFDMGKIEETPFRYCGKEITQDDDFTIHVATKNNTEKIEQINIPQNRKAGPATEGEISQLRSVVGSLAWVARESRPDIAYRTSRLQSRCAKATVADLRECNKVVEYVISTSSVGLTFTPGDIDWDRLVLLTITDASFSNEEDVVDGVLRPYRSQRGRLHFLCSHTLLEGAMQSPVHMIGFGSTLIKRVCRATLQAETYALQDGVENGFRLRALLAEIHDRLGDHEAFCPHLWLSDCASLVQHLTANNGAKVADKRLGIEMESLRQPLEETRCA